MRSGSTSVVAGRWFRWVGFLGGRSEKVCQVIFPSLIPNGPLHDVSQVIIVHVQTDPVHLQEGKSCHGRSPFVAIHKRMILRNVKHIRRSHFEHICVEILFSKCYEWLSEGRFEEIQTLISTQSGFTSCVPKFLFV